MAIASKSVTGHQPMSIKLDYPLQPWVVVLSAALFFFYEFIQMNMFNAIDPSLIKAYSVTATQLGNLSAMYFYGNVVFLFPAGMLLDRFSTRRLLLMAMVLCVFFTYLFAFSVSLHQAELCRFVTGLASTFCMLSAVRLASRWFPPRRIALVIGLVVTIAMAGGMFAQTPLTYLVNWLGWRHAVMVNATLGVLFTFVVFRFVRDYPKGAQAIHLNEKQQLKSMGFWQSVFLAMQNKQNWLAGLFTNFLSFPVVILGASWGSLYLIHVRHLSHLTTTYITTMIFLGTIIGSPLTGWLSDFIGYRRLPMMVGAALSLLIVLLIMWLPGLTLVPLMILFFLLGLVASTQVITYPLVVESNPRALTTTAEGLTCTLVMTAGLFQLVFGWLVDLNWHGTMHNGLRVYSAHAYQMAMWMLPIAFLVALVATFFLKETYCKGEGND